MSEQTDADNTDQSVSDVDSSTPRERLFSIPAFTIKTTTGRKMTIFTCGDVYSNYICNSLQMCLDGFDALEEFLLECQAAESVHGIHGEQSDKMFDLMEKCQDAYNRCRELSDTLL